MPTAIRMIEATKGMRQPQLSSASCDMKCSRIQNTPEERNRPTGAPSCGNMPYQLRLPGGAFSVASRTAPPHSPPRPKPWPKRHSASNSGARTPAVS
ncbi:hypothetical protein D3C72_2144290 [compost metagenome]